MAGGELVNTAGNVVHYLGFGWAGDIGRPVAAVDAGARTRSGSAPAPLSSSAGTLGTPSGASTNAISCTARTSTSRLRLRLAGWGVGIEPAARVVHDYEFAKGDYKWFYLERNRWWTIARRLSRAAAGPAGSGPAGLRGRACAGRVARRLATRKAARAGRRAAQPADDGAPTPGGASHATDRAAGVRGAAFGIAGFAVSGGRGAGPRGRCIAALVLAWRKGRAPIACISGSTSSSSSQAHRAAVRRTPVS